MDLIGKSNTYTEMEKNEMNASIGSKKNKVFKVKALQPTTK